jgi:hypothetical protein
MASVKDAVKNNRPYLDQVKIAKQITELDRVIQERKGSLHKKNI